jgi:hypothetical protein
MMPFRFMAQVGELFFSVKDTFTQVLVDLMCKGRFGLVWPG